MNNFLKTMYARSQARTQSSSKNPNRVLGGLRGQGVDSITVLGEDGVEHSLPSKAYIIGLEDKIRTMDTKIQMLEKQMRRSKNDSKMD